MPKPKLKHLDGSRRIPIHFKEKNISLFTVPRSPPRRMLFFREIGDLTNENVRTVKKYALRFHFIAIEHRTILKNILIKNHNELTDLKGEINIEFIDYSLVIKRRKELEHAASSETT